MEIKYRSVFNETYFGVIKNKIDLEMPSKSANPFACKPFKDAYEYGLEITYPYKTDLIVQNNDGKLDFICDWSKDQDTLSKVSSKPVGSISDGFFGLASGLDIQVPENFVLRIETHPNYYLKENYPCVVPGNLETYWWSSLFFLVFKSPPAGKSITFTYGMPIAKFVVVPQNVEYEISKMTEDEEEKRRKNFATINENRKILGKSYTDNKGQAFDTTYKNLSCYIKNNGCKKLESILESLESKNLKIKKCLFKKKRGQEDPVSENNNINYIPCIPGPVTEGDEPPAMVPYPRSPEPPPALGN